MIYLRSMCFKNIKQYEEAAADYKSLIRLFNLNENKDKRKYVFGLLLLPLQRNRNVITYNI